MYVRIDLLQPLPETDPESTPREAIEEFFNFLLNELSNQGIAAHMTIVNDGSNASCN